jgi:hypothetical protein
MKPWIFLLLCIVLLAYPATAEVYSGFWTGVSRDMPATPYGNVTAISSHNCYVHDTSPSASLTGTLDKIHAAQDKNADLIELDIILEGGNIHVDHDDNGDADGAYLQQVLGDTALRFGDEILYIEIKESTISESFIFDLLFLLSAYGYAVNGRPVVLRAFHTRRGHLFHAKNLLEETFTSIADHVYLSELFGLNETAPISAFQDLVMAAKTDGFDMVEFNYQNDNLFSLVALSRSLGLGVNLWTIPLSFGEVFIAALRDEVDVLTVDYDVAKARQIVKDKNGLLYLNTSLQSGAGNFVRSQRNKNTTFVSAINQDAAPDYEILGLGEDRFGGSLVFNAADQQYVSFYDGDNSPDQGYLAAVVVNFDDLTLEEGETSSILAKSDGGGFCIELHNPTSGDSVLRFGVRVDSSYRYATCPLSTFNGTDSYWIIGAYDGYGGVYLWIDNSRDGTTTSSGTSEVVQNNSPILLGADPQGAASRRFYFSGKIQAAILQDWGSH